MRVSVKAARIVALLALLPCQRASAEPSNQVLTLGGALATALQRHPALEVARQRTREAGERVEQQKSQNSVNADVSVNATRYDWLPPNKERILGGGSTDVYTDVRLQKLLYSGGRVRAMVTAADRSLQIAVEGERRANQALTFEVTRAFYRVVEAERVVAAREEAMRQMEQHAQLARDLLSVGKVPRVDVLRAEVRVADVKQALIRARNALKLARLSLSNAIGVPSDPGVAVRADLTLPSTPPGAAEALEDALAHRPEWRQSELARQRGQAEFTAVQAEYRPTLSAVGSYNLEGSDTPTINNWNVGVVVSMPLFDGGRRRASANQAQARLEATDAEQALLRQRIEFEVNSALLRLEDALERARATETAVSEARDSLAIERERYRLGMSTSVDVFDAQVSLTQADVNYTQALTDARIAAAEIAFATGRDLPAGSVESEGTVNR